jgi:putative oxidoreductase
MDFEAIGTAWAPRLLSVLRIVSGLMFLQHGMAKYLKFPPVPALANVDPMSLPGVGGMFELVGGILLILGLFTRPVALLLSGEMAIAYFVAHAPRSFFAILNGGELAAFYCFVFLYIAAAGPGPWSIDAARKK